MHSISPADCWAQRAFSPLIFMNAAGDNRVEQGFSPALRLLQFSAVLAAEVLAWAFHIAEEPPNPHTL